MVNHQCALLPVNVVEEGVLMLGKTKARSDTSQVKGHVVAVHGTAGHEEEEGPARGRRRDM
jgi:hypothetical protein